MNDLNTQIGRETALAEIENSFLTSLSKSGVKISPTSVCRLERSYIQLGIKSPDTNGWKMAFASEIDLYSKNNDFFNNENEINICSSGSFTPSHEPSYWRTVHAANVLQNWDKVCDIINEHCKMYNDFLEKLRNL